MTDEIIDDGKIRHTLLKPIEAHGETITVIVFREPVAGDFIKAGGMPVIMDPSSDRIKFDINPEPMSAFMARLAQVPPSTIDRMHPKDWQTCAWALAPFFIPEVPTM